MLNPWRLRLLHQLSNLGTVRAVAQAAMMSPSSVSAQLAVLETETHTQLLERVGRRVRLTPAGVILADRAATILDLMDTVQAEISGLTTAPTGPVRLACFPSAMRTLVIPAARTISELYPLIDLQIVEQEPAVSTRSLDRGECDIAVTANFQDSSAPLQTGTQWTSLDGDDVVLVLPRGAAGDAGDAGLGPYANHQWSTDLPGTYLADLTLRACRQAGYEPHITGRFSSIEGLLRHVEAGLSIALLPRLAVDDRYQVGISTLKDLPRRHIWAVTRTSTNQRVAIEKTVLALLHAVAPPHMSHR